MEYRQLASVSATLMLQIVKKCYPIPYVRLRQSCRFMDEFCEKNRKRLGIYCYRKDPHLHFGNCGVPFSYYRKRNEKRIETMDPYLAVNYGEGSEDTNFVLPMIKENVPRIRGSLSGFGFTHVTVDTISFFPEPTYLESFIEAFKIFLELAAEFHVKHVNCPTCVHLKPIVDVWKLESLKFIHWVFDIPLWEFLDPVKIKNVPCVTYKIKDSREEHAHFFYEENIKEIASGKRYLRIVEERKLARKTIWNALNYIYKDWKMTQNVPEEVVLEHYFNKDETWNSTEDGTIYLPKEFIYIGQFPFEQKVTYNMWILKLEDIESWRVLLTKRGASDQIMSFSVKTVRSNSQLALFLIDFFQSSFARRVPLDFSTFYNYLITSKTIEEINFHIFVELSILKPLYFEENE